MTFILIFLSFFFMLSLSSFLIMAYSQSGEYVEFLQEICVSSGNCNSNETPTFISLAVNVQVEFVWLLCPNKKQSCYEHYLNLPDLEQIKFNVSNFDEIPDGSFTIGAVEGCDDAINDGFVVGAVR